MIDTRKPVLLLLATSLLTAWVLQAQAQTRSRSGPYFHRTTSEKIQQIPITQAQTGTRQPLVLYSLGPIDLTDDIPLTIEVRFQAGLTKRCAGSVQLGYYVVREKSAQAVDGTYMTPYAIKDLPQRPSARENLPLHPDEGINFSISQHSMFQRGIDDPPATDTHVNVVVFAESNDSSCIGKTLQVKGGDVHDYHGELIVQQYH